MRYLNCVYFTKHRHVYLLNYYFYLLILKTLNTLCCIMCTIYSNLKYANKKTGICNYKKK